MEGMNLSLSIEKEEKTKRKKEAYELWTQLSAMLESGCVTLGEMRPTLLKIKKFFGNTTPLAKYVNEILLMGSDATAVEVDSIRQLLHEEWDETIQKSDLRKAINLKYG